MSGSESMHVINLTEYMWQMAFNLLFEYFFSLSFDLNNIGGVVISVLPSSVTKRRFDPLSCQTKDYHIGLCCFSAMHAELRRMSKD
jgi:hypothetical protein